MVNIGVAFISDTETAKAIKSIAGPLHGLRGSDQVARNSLCRAWLSAEKVHAFVVPDDDLPIRTPWWPEVFWCANEAGHEVPEREELLQ
jgi:hypothetical protein